MKATLFKHLPRKSAIRDPSNQAHPREISGLDGDTLCANGPR